MSLQPFAQDDKTPSRLKSPFLAGLEFPDSRWQRRWAGVLRTYLGNVAARHVRPEDAFPAAPRPEQRLLVRRSPWPTLPRARSPSCSSGRELSEAPSASPRGFTPVPSAPTGNTAAGERQTQRTQPGVPRRCPRHPPPPHTEEDASSHPGSSPLRVLGPRLPSSPEAERAAVLGVYPTQLFGERAKKSNISRSCLQPPGHRKCPKDSF